LCYEEEKNYLEAMIQRGNRGIVGHVIETSTVEASTVTSSSIYQFLKVILKDTEDWLECIEVIKSAAIGLETWDHINPETANERLRRTSLAYTGNC
jgi:hypothetical protein